MWVSVETLEIVCKQRACVLLITQLWALWWVQVGLQVIAVPKQLVSLGLSGDVPPADPSPVSPYRGEKSIQAPPS